MSPGRVELLTSTELKRLHRSWRRRTPDRLALILDGVQNPFDVGAIIRSAAAFRVDHLWLAGSTATPSHDKTRKTALGSERFVPYTSVESIVEAVEEAGAAGFCIKGLELAEGSLPIQEADLAGDIALMVGHEDRGISAKGLANCDDVLYVPQLGRIGSLNVATAVAIAAYEVRRRRWKPQSG